MKASIKFEGVSWNTEWIRKFPKVDDFVKHPSNAGKFKDNADAKLKELHALVHGKPKKEEKDPIPAPEK